MVVLFSQVEQVEVVVEQVLKAAMEVPVGKDGLLQSVALDSSQTQLHKNITHVIYVKKKKYQSRKSQELSSPLGFNGKKIAGKSFYFFIHRDTAFNGA